jgi:hypothetical protein
MSKEEIIAAVKKCAEELGRAPNQPEFRTLTKITKNEIRKNFGTFTQMMAASGVDCRGSGVVVDFRSLFLDWAGLVRNLGKVPSMSDYEVGSKFSVRPLQRRFRSWGQVPSGMLEYVRKERLEEEWKDVLEIIESHPKKNAEATQTSAPIFHMPSNPRIVGGDKLIFGPPAHAPLICAPTNEQGVLFAFGSVARELGFSMLQVQTAFPDCIGLRHIGGGRWQWVKIELEYESRNFLSHMHSSAGCDLIVCWRHNWPECPVEVIELQNVEQIWKRPL